MSEFEFKPYLSAIATHYDQWWRLYTLSDAEGKQAEAKGQFFEFGLMVERREEREKTEEGREKVERLDVLAGLRKYAAEHVLLVGRPGSGKSTALARLMLEMAGDGGQIPVLVELRSWQSSILDLICNSCKRHGLVLSIAQVQTLLDDRKLLLLIDGVNELPSEVARTDVGNFRRNHPKVPMIFTTRDLSLGGDLGIGKKLEMQALTEEQMRSFVQAYLPEQGEVMLRQLQGRLREMGQTPLLLWMLCSLFRRAEVIPANLGEVFRMFTQGYERQIKGDVVVEGDRRWWSGLLQELAARMMNPLVGVRIPRPEALRSSVEFRVAISPVEIESIFTEYFQDKETQPAGAARKALDDLLKHHLIQRNGDLVEFRHQLIQEYYAAEWLLVRVGDLDDDTLKRDYLNYLKWTESVALMLALVEDEGLAVRVVERSLEVDLMLGARLAGNVKTKYQIVTILCIEELKIQTWLKIDLLEKTNSEFILPKLFEFISDEDEIICIHAIETLGRIKSDQSVPVLLKAITHFTWKIRWNAGEALRKIGSKSSLPGLLKAMQDPNMLVSKKAAEAMQDIKHNAEMQESSADNFPINAWEIFLKRLGKDIDYHDECHQENVRSRNFTHEESVVISYVTREELEECLGGELWPSGNLPAFQKLLFTNCEVDEGREFLIVIQTTQENCKFYNYEIFHSPPAKPQPTQQSPPAATINQFPNATEIKIFENIQTYNASPPRDPPP
jgi:HEAT repeats/NACHT domain